MVPYPPLSPPSGFQELATSQYGVPSSVPQPRILIAWPHRAPYIGVPTHPYVQTKLFYPPLSPPSGFQELATSQYGVPSSVPQPRILIAWPHRAAYIGVPTHPYVQTKLFYPPLSPPSGFQELATSQYGVPSSVPQPRILIAWPPRTPYMEFLHIHTYKPNCFTYPYPPSRGSRSWLLASMVCPLQFPSPGSW